ncbi:hypothetical protein V2J09_016130 [Rumex salicifolius]
MEATKRQSYRWWFDSHNNGTGRSQWLNSTLSALDEKTKAMLMIIEEDADSFSQRAEMYYKKRPQLVGMVEDFYRAHRSLAEQFDHLRHEPGARRTSPLARSFSHSMGQPEKRMDPHKSYDGCFTKFASYTEDLFTPLSKDSVEKSLDVLAPLSNGSPEKPFAGRYTNLAYDSDESFDSEVDDPADFEAVDSGEEISSAEENHGDLMAEIERLSEQNVIQKKQLMEKDMAIEELNLKLSKTATEVMELKEEAERLRLENVEMYLLNVKDTEEKESMANNFKKEKDLLIAENSNLNMMLMQKHKETREAMKDVEERLEEKDEEKREAIRQLSIAIELLKDENCLLKKTLVYEANKRWNPFESQVLKGFGKLFNCSILSSHPSVVPL